MRCSCNERSTDFVFAVGEVAAVFSSRGARWEYQNQQRGLGGGRFKTVVAHAPFLARAVTWILQVEGREQYLLSPRTQHELDEFVEVARLREPGLEEGNGATRVAIIGTLSPLDPGSPDPLPTLVVEAIHHWTEAEPAPGSGEAARTHERLWRATQNAGVAEGDRALNFVVSRSEELHARVAELLEQGCRGIRVHHEPCRLAHARRREVNVVLAWTSADGVAGAESLRVDASGLHPYPTDPAFRPYHPKLGGA